MRGPNICCMKFAAHQPVTMLAAVGALVFTDQRECFLGDRARMVVTSAGSFMLSTGTHVQTPDRGVGVPGTFRAMPLEDVVQPLGVVREISPDRRRNPR